MNVNETQFTWFRHRQQRQNQTYHPSRPLTYNKESVSIGQLNLVKKAELVLFLEVERGLDLCPVALVNMRKDDILLFFKLYDSEKEKLRYVGRLFVNCTGKPSDILARLNELAGFDLNEEIEIYEEIMFEPYVMCVPIDKNLTFIVSQIGNGDILCFQRSLAAGNEKSVSFPDVPSYLEHVHRELSAKKFEVSKITGGAKQNHQS